jgi:hypothetical protein
MQNIDAYVYDNQITVLADTQTPTLRARIVYARTVKLSRNLDNTLVFDFKNSQQRPIDLTGRDVVMTVVDEDSHQTLLEVPAVLDGDRTGRVSVSISQTQLQSLPRDNYVYSLRLIDVDLNEIAVYTDDNWTQRGQLQIQLGPVAEFQPSAILELSDLQDDVVVTSALLTQGTVHTLQVLFDGFSGQIETQVTVDPQPSTNEINWITVQTDQYQDQIATVGWNVVGSYTALRLRITPTQGQVTKVLARSG